MGKKWITDLAMTVLLLLLMAYSLVGEVLHEWMGIAMLVLFILHHIWNRAWYKSIGRGRPSPHRAVQTALNFLLFAVVLGMLLSGLILSQHILDFLPLRPGETIARTLHLPLAYWGVLLMSLHLGLHWSGIMNTVRRRTCIGAGAFRLRRRPYRAVRPGETRRSGHGNGVYRRYPHPDSHG